MTARYPWPTYRHPWSLDVSSVRIDGATRDDVDLDTTRRLDLTSIDDWRELELDVRAQAGDGLDLQLHGVHVLVEAVATGLRRPYPLVAAQGGYVGTLRVHRADVAGAVHVHAVVSAVVDGRIRAADPPTPGRSRSTGAQRRCRREHPRSQRSGGTSRATRRR